MFHDLWGYRFCSLANSIDSFDPFNTRLIEFLLMATVSNTYAWHEVWHRLCLEESCDASNQLAGVMQRITIRGFTPEEVLNPGCDEPPCRSR